MAELPWQDPRCTATRCVPWQFCHIALTACYQHLTRYPANCLALGSERSAPSDGWSGRAAGNEVTQELGATLDDRVAVADAEDFGVGEIAELGH